MSCSGAVQLASGQRGARGVESGQAVVDGKRKSKRTDAKHRHFQRMCGCAGYRGRVLWITALEHDPESLC